MTVLVKFYFEAEILLLQRREIELATENFVKKHPQVAAIPSGSKRQAFVDPLRVFAHIVI